MNLATAQLVLEAALDTVIREGMEPNEVVEFVHAYLYAGERASEEVIAEDVLNEPPPDVCPTCEGTGQGPWSQERAERVWQEFAERFGGTIEEAKEVLGTDVGYEPCETCGGHGRLAPPNLDAPPLVLGEQPSEDDAPPEKHPLYELLEAAYPLVPDESKIEATGSGLALRTSDAEYLYGLCEYWTGGRLTIPSSRKVLRQDGGDAKHRARLLRHAARAAAGQIGWVKPGVRRP